ncbi:hypothetical protein C2S52_009777 [Perilla frutescens var. hirtella]|nr:hypothetical protein C2S52_009777 [Perilla frutescens var. hirtella]
MLFAIVITSIPRPFVKGVIVYNATVSKLQKPGAFNTVTEALAAAPSHSNTKYYIHVEAGLYVERVEVGETLTNIVLVGDGANVTKIQWNRHAPQYNTSRTATLTVEGNGFIAMFIAFENNAGEDLNQAVAAETVSDRAAYYQCTFLGYQDTLYARKGAQLYKNCDIYGTVDFIFGAAAAVFQSCNLYARSAKTITFTAQNKDGDGGGPVSSGFVIQDCTLTAAPGVERAGLEAYLGRPWSEYSTVVVMESYLDDIIQPEGWVAWNKDGRTDELRYLEFRNRGGGADTSRRVNWKGYEDVSGLPDKVQGFTVAEFIDRDGWLAGTGVPYSPGLMHN